MEDSDSIAAILARDYVIMKVFDSNQDGNAEFLKKFPEFYAYPHLIVLDRNGDLLHSQDSEELESPSGYDAEKFAAFLKKWAPKRGGNPD